MTAEQTTGLQMEKRTKSAEFYLTGKSQLEGQQKWYSSKATFSKTWHLRFGFLIIAAGAATSVVQLWVPSQPDTSLHWTPVVTAILGAIVVLAKGLDRLCGFDEKWMNYRQASEAIKRERRLYINAAGLYISAADEGDAYRLFVERVEDIIAAEQKTFWQNARKLNGEEPSPPEAAESQTAPGPE